MKTKQMKRQEADARNNYWTSLSINQKLTRLAARPGNCEKQIKRIETQA